MPMQEKDPRQVAYEQKRAEHREVWWAERIEDFCACHEVDPRNGRFIHEWPELR